MVHLYHDSTRVCLNMLPTGNAPCSRQCKREQEFSRAISANRYCIVSTNFTFSFRFIVIQLSKCNPANAHTSLELQ